MEGLLKDQSDDDEALPAGKGKRRMREAWLPRGVDDAKEFEIEVGAAANAAAGAAAIRGRSELLPGGT